MPPIETLYLIHHSHTDIGFTHDQPIVWELHGRFIDQALNIIEAHAADPAPDSRFRWTVETTAVLDHWLRQATAADIDRLLRAERAQLLGWVTNNYWMTNFQPAQPGRVHARYRLWPYAGPFDEARGHRLGAEAAHARLVVQHLGEPPAATTPWPASGRLLALPAEPILTLHVRAGAEPGTLLLRLWNASDTPQAAVIGSGLLRVQAAHQCDLFDQPQAALAVTDGAVRCTLPPRQVCVVQLRVAV